MMLDTEWWYGETEKETEDNGQLEDNGQSLSRKQTITSIDRRNIGVNKVHKSMTKSLHKLW